MSLPYRPPLQQQQRQQPAEDEPIPFFGGQAGSNASPAHRNAPPPRPLQRGPSHQHYQSTYHQQQYQQYPQHSGAGQQPPRPPQFQRHPQQHPDPFPQAQAQQQYQQSSSQQAPPQPPAQQRQQQLNPSELAPAADLFASPPTANRQLPHGPAKPQGYQPQAVNDLFGVQHQQHQQHQQQTRQQSQQQTQQSALPQQQSQQVHYGQPPVRQQSFQRHPHHPVPVNQPSQGYGSTSPLQTDNGSISFGSTSDLFGVSSQRTSEHTASPKVAMAAAGSFANTAGTLGLQRLRQGHAAAPISSSLHPKGRPPLPPALQKRPSLTPASQAQQTSSAQLVPLQLQQNNNQQQQHHHHHQQQQQQLQRQQQSHSRQASLSSQSPLLQRYSPSTPGPHGFPNTDQATTQHQPLSRNTPGTPHHGPISGPSYGSPHTNYVQPKTPSLSASRAASIVPEHVSQDQQLTPPLTQTPYIGALKSQFGSTAHLLEPCPFPECTGENKPQAKFCSECGRSISMASRSATPSLLHRSELISHQEPVATSLARMSSYFGDQSQYESHQSPENQQQQPYDPAFGQYLDQQSSPSDQSNYIPEPAPVAPEPERINDSLNRHLGYPIVAFGFGGNIVSWFPCTQHNHDSRALKVQKISDLIPVDTVIANYPGPLLNDSSVQLKNKRKELLKLIEDKISELGQAQDKGIFDAHRVLIWKLFKVMFEQDGTLVGGSKIDEAVKIVLASIPITKIPLPSIHQKSAEEISASVDALQEILRQGDLAASVRHAIESHLWAHALVISSHGDRELWKEAVNGFVSHELSGQDGLHANGRASLRVLYSLFSGQSEKAALELIPQDLRAQYLENTSDLSTQTKIPPESLVQWRDTLILILSNRTEGDQATINALGNLLMKEGWVEAAHICYLLSPQFSVHSGPDTSHVSMVLLGASHSPHTIYPYYKNVESFQKTEIYEFGCALKSSGATGGLPFLQAYKLIYIWSLLDQGMFSEVARYLESVEMIVKSQTKGSPYYNSTFHAQLNDAIERLAGSVHAAHAGPWLSKKTPQPTTDTVFNAFKSESMEHNARAHDQAQHATSVENSLSVDPSPQILAGQTHRVDPSPVAAGAEAGSEDQHYDGDNAKSHILTDPNMGYEHGEQGHAYDAFQQYGADYGQASTGEHQDHEQQSQSAVYYGGEQGEQEQNQTYAQYDTLNASHDHHDDNTSAVPNSVLSTQAVAGSVQRSPEDLHGTVLGHEMQDSEFDGGYAPYSEGSYDVTRQDTAVYQDGEYQEQQPHVEAEQAHENTSTYDVSNQYYHQDQEPYQANLDYTTDQDLGAQYTDPNPRRADDYTHVQTSQQDQHDAAPHTDAASADEPTMEQQAAHAPEDDQKYAIQDKQYHQGQDPQTAKHGSELQHSGYEGADHDNASFQQQGGYDPQGYSYEGHHQDAEHQQGQYPQGEYQQSSYHEGGYQQGDYAQVSHQGGEYQNNDYQTGNNQQEDYQQGGYHQGDYQQGNYHQGEYQQGEYQSGQYQQYQEGDYTQAEHQHDVFSTSDYQSNDNNQQQGHLYATQSSTEPGVLPVSSEEDPSTAEFAPAATTGTVQDLQEGDYEEGQFVSFGAIPSFPTFGGQQQNKQVATSTSQQPDRQTAGEDVDDLGMGNQSLRREKITASAPPAEGSISASHGQQSAGTDGQPGQGSEEAGSGWWPVINLFGSEKREPTPKPAKANLSEGSTFYFDNELQRWVNKSAPDSQTSTEPLPPPPKVRAPASPSTPGLSGPPGLPGPLRPTGAAGGPPLPQARPAGGSTVRRGARARYVDVLNP